MKHFTSILIIFQFWTAFGQESKISELKTLAKAYEKKGNDTLQIATLLDLAFLYNDINLDSSAAILDKTQELIQKTDWRMGILLLSRARCHFYFRAGLYDRALEEGLIAQKLAEKYKLEQYQASMNIRIGTILTYLHRYKEATIYLLAGTAIYKKIALITDYGVALANLGDMYLKSGEYLKAIANLNKAMEIIYQSNDNNLLKTSRIVAGSNLLAVAYLNAEMPDSSRKYEKICIELGNKIENNHNQFDLYLGFASHYNRKKNAELSNIYANKALEKARALNSIEKKSAVFKLFYQNFSILRNTAESLKYLELHKNLEDSIQRINVNKQIAIISDRQELIQQKSQIQNLTIVNLQKSRSFLYTLLVLAIISLVFFFWINNRLKSHNLILLQKNKEISEAYLIGQTTERQRVAIDLHDNLGSTISSIKYSLEAIDRSKMNAEEVAVQENLYSLLDKAYNDVRLLSHNLLPEEFEKKGLAETLTEFIKKINKASKIKFDLKIDDNFGRQDNKIEFELYSICMELVNNIMKHSKATVAIIEISKSENQIILMVEDNGIGIFENNSDGVGMKNIQARVDSINGKWNVKTAENEGVVNEITVNIS